MHWTDSVFTWTLSCFDRIHQTIDRSITTAYVSQLLQRYTVRGNLPSMRDRNYLLLIYLLNYLKLKELNWSRGAIANRRGSAVDDDLGMIKARFWDINVILTFGLSPWNLAHRLLLPRRTFTTISFFSTPFCFRARSPIRPGFETWTKDRQHSTEFGRASWTQGRHKSAANSLSSYLS